MALEPVGSQGAIGGPVTILSQRDDIMYVTPSNVQDAVTVTARDNKYGIVFSFTRSKKSWEGGATHAAASFYAGMIQEMAIHPHVVGLQYTQGVNQNGLLQDQMIVTVGTDDGESSVSYTWPLETLDSAAAYTKADSTYQTLTAAYSQYGASSEI